MVKQDVRTAILELHGKGVGKKIAHFLGISKGAVRRVIASRSAAVPTLVRKEKADPHRQEILGLLEECKGNLVRVHEELVRGGARLSYSALTAFFAGVRASARSPRRPRAATSSRRVRSSSTTPRLTR